MALHSVRAESVEAQPAIVEIAGHLASFVHCEMSRSVRRTTLDSACGAITQYLEQYRRRYREKNEVAGLVFDLYAGFPGPMIQTSIYVAEMVKCVDNAFHALKVTFANEIGQLCRCLGIDSHEVMSIFSQDTKLNISKAYSTPGFA